MAVERDGFMESFFRRVGFNATSWMCAQVGLKILMGYLCIKVEEVRGLIYKISYQVEEVRKMHSMILTAPNPHDSKCGIL